MDDFSDLRLFTEVRGGVTGTTITHGDGSETIWLRLALVTSLRADDFLFG